jgi:hypothetical protein
MMPAVSEPRSRATEPSRLERALPLLLIAGVLLVLVLPVLDPSLQLYDRDTARHTAPFKWEIWRRFALHQLPLWVTWTEGGSSILGQMTPGLFHPTALLYLLPLDFELLFKLEHLLALPLAALGMFLLARFSGARRFGAAGGALAYAGSGWVVSNVASNLQYALGAAAMPLALHGLGRFLETRRPLWLFWGSFALACPILGGEPQSALFAGLIGVAIAVGARADATDLHTNHWRTNLLHRVALIAIWGLAALALSAPAALPVALRLHGTSASPGRHAGRDYFQLPAWRLPGLLLPGAFDDTTETTKSGAYSPYADLAKTAPGQPFAQGIALGAPLFLLALFAPRRKRRWLLGASLICALAALGPLLFVDGVLLRIFPPFAWFRFPEKWLAPLTLLVSLAGALGLTELFESEGARSCKALPAAAGSAIGLAALALALQLFSARAEQIVTAAMNDHSAVTAELFVARLRSALWLEAGLLAVLAALLALADRPGIARLAPALCAAILGTSALADSQSLLYTMPLELLRAPAPVAALLRSRADLQTGPLRIDSRPEVSVVTGASDARTAVALWRMHALATEDNAFSGVENLDSNNALRDTDYQLLLVRAPELLRSLFDAQFQLQAGALLGPEQFAHEGWAWLPDGLAMRQRPSSPRAFLLACAESLEPLDGLTRMLSRGFDPHRVAIAGREDAALLGDLRCVRNGEQPLQIASWTRPSPEEIDVDAEARAPSLLLVSEHFDPGWSVSIDGEKRVPALHLDHAVLGAKLSAGKHHLVFRFFPRGLFGGLATALGCAILLLLLELRWRRQRAQKS